MDSINKLIAELTAVEVNNCTAPDFVGLDSNFIGYAPDEIKKLYILYNFYEVKFEENECKLIPAMFDSNNEEFHELIKDGLRIKSKINTLLQLFTDACHFHFPATIEKENILIGTNWKMFWDGDNFSNYVDKTQERLSDIYSNEINKDGKPVDAHHLH